MSTDVETNKRVALKFLDLAFKIDMEDAISMLADDATWWVIGDPHRLRVAGLKNREQTVRMLRNMHKIFPNGMTHRIVGVTAEGDRVAVEVDAAGSWSDGSRYQNAYHFLLRLHNGKVAEIREYMDTMQIK
jgi:ketosteroid isomerase-like protein